MVSTGEVSMEATQPTRGEPKKERRNFFFPPPNHAVATKSSILLSKYHRNIFTRCFGVCEKKACCHPIFVGYFWKTSREYLRAYTQRYTEIHREYLQKFFHLRACKSWAPTILPPNVAPLCNGKVSILFPEHCTHYHPLSAVIQQCPKQCPAK